MFTSPFIKLDEVGENSAGAPHGFHPFVGKVKGYEPILKVEIDSKPHISQARPVPYVKWSNRSCTAYSAREISCPWNTSKMISRLPLALSPY